MNSSLAKRPQHQQVYQLQLSFVFCSNFVRGQPVIQPAPQSCGLPGPAAARLASSSTVGALQRPRLQLRLTSWGALVARHRTWQFAPLKYKQFARPAMLQKRVDLRVQQHLGFRRAQPCRVPVQFGRHGGEYQLLINHIT